MPDARCARLLRAGVKKRRVEDPKLLQDKSHTFPHALPSDVTTIALVLTSPADLSAAWRAYEAGASVACSGQARP